jgi:hypothetical protein
VKLRLLLGVLLVGLASACGGGDDDAGGGGGAAGGDDSGVVNVTLAEQDGSGKSGKAQLLAGAASTDVTIEITGASDNDPIHVHSGTCDSPGEEIVHDVGFTTASLGHGQIFATIDQVATGELVLDIHDDKTDKVIMCGAIPAQ